MDDFNSECEIKENKSTMSKKFKLNIVLTNGKIRKPVVWISKTNSGWSWGLYYKKAVNHIKQDVHFSHQNDGNVHTHFYDDAKLHKNIAIPLNSKSIIRIGGASFIPTIDEETIWRDSSLNEQDKILLIDNTEYVRDNCRVLWDAYQLEPNKQELINEIHKGKPTNPKVHIYDDFMPWLVVCIYKQKVQ